MSFKHISVFFLREIHVFKKRFLKTMIDGLVVTSMHLLSLKYFLPAMGMNPEWQTPLYLGNILSLCFVSSYIRGIDITRDIDGSNFLQYQCALPGKGLYALYAYVFGFTLHMVALVAPILGFGLLFLNGVCSYPGSLLGLFFMVLLVSIFFAFLLLTLSIFCRPDAYLDNVWPRILGPLFVFGGVFYTWKRIALLTPFLAKFFLLSPVLYCSEGLRGALLTDADYISLPVCITVLVLSIMILWYLMKRALKHRIDYVEGV